MIGTLAAIAGGAAAASLAGMHTMVPWSQLYGANFRGIEKSSPVLALTYDDGPNEPYTRQLLEVLDRRQAKATFFLLGRYVEAKPEIVRDIVAAGHEIGNHSWSHPNLIFASPAELRKQIEDTTKAIEDACGITPVLFRPPFGGRRPGTLQTARRYGMTPVMWRVSTYDWEANSPEFILQRARKGIVGGDVILMHDGGHLTLGTDRRHTVVATDRLIEEYGAKGFRFVTVSAMIKEQSALSSQHSVT